MRAQVIRAIAACLLLAPAAANADGCAIEGGQIAFGRLEPMAQGEHQAIGMITLRCDGAEGSVVRIGLGAGNSMRPEQREMRDGEHRIRYNLYLDPARERVFGDDTHAGSALTLVLSRAGAPLDIPVYGAIAGGQRLRPGTYSDQITITVDF